VAEPGVEDGIIGVPGGLIHHWRAATFIPGATLDAVLRVAQDYRASRPMYPWVLAAGVLAHEGSRSADVERFRVFLRIERSASVVTSVVDLWATVDYWYPRADRALAISDANCIRQVEDAGTRRERRLAVGTGSGYLWRANTFSAYLERDGGVYVQFETIGLSREFPALLGWIVEPIARRIGRGSASESLERLRTAVLSSGKPARPDTQHTDVVPGFWCTADSERAGTQ
jgi:hypothetical protein